MVGRGASGNLRRCLATGESGPTATLVRFALAPDGCVVPDLAGRLPGRGAWVGARREAIEQAVAKNLFSRAFRAGARPETGLADTVERLLAARIATLLGMARRAGAAVAGFEKCRSWLAARGTVLLHARDGSVDGLRKLAGADATRAIRLLDAAELGAPFGRRRVVHVALAGGRLAANIEGECARLAGLREAAREGREGRQA